MQDLAVGAANGGWKVLSWVEYRKAGQMVHAVKVHGSPLRLSVTGTGRSIFVNLPNGNDIGNGAYRFVVKSADGREMPYTGLVPSRPGSGYQSYLFEGKVEDVSQVILQSRAYEWHTIRVAHFRPGAN
jgi:hypothetical protein